MKPAPVLEVVAYGLPAPQGSKKGFPVHRKGGGIGVALVESAKGLKPWREAVRKAAITAVAASGCVAGPVVAELIFTLPRPKSKTKCEDHWVKPDLSKLIRAVEDALTDAGAFEDDARIVSFTDTAKRYVGNRRPGTLDRPGVLIRLFTATNFHRS